ncbi:DUF1080 domain-containing protein [uncultured Draconibacterium sp.]|uniref:3-keto-disaccharide hydrolase n=1 Tax=uncultured Draconibacterium sp. TaxID=1573823 RepID=UPI0032611E26
MRRNKTQYKKSINTSIFTPTLKTLVILVGLSLLTLQADAKRFKKLFNGKTLEGWTAARSLGEGDWGNFSVNRKEKAIHVYAGETHGSRQETDCLNTITEFSHYILKLEYKWLEKRFDPRVDWDRDAGLLFHVHGDRKKVWPWCIEMQIGESPADKTEKRRFHTGDLFVLGDHIQVKAHHTDGWYDPNGDIAEPRALRTKLGVEKPKGKWNKMEIHVHGSKKATFILNGEVVLEIFDFVQKADDGSTSPLEIGSIGLQAEFAELLYRKIRIKELPSE